MMKSATGQTVFMEPEEALDINNEFGDLEVHGASGRSSRFLHSLQIRIATLLFRLCERPTQIS